MTKYSSYKKHQLITENWRKFVNEETSPWEDYAMADDRAQEWERAARRLPDMAQRQLNAIAQSEKLQLDGDDVHLKIEEVMLGLIASLLRGEIAADDAMQEYSNALFAIDGFEEHIPPKGSAMWDLTGPQELVYVAGELVDIAAWARRNIEERDWTIEDVQKSMEKARPRSWGQRPFRA